ncbi:uncharacterized protein LOC124283975 [Haliotis rubra]|uniref:uncharacterized protein LOC124283975 n=1 Tax=Haliotis rubra TaxID=36100 RepID=UPI001EE5DF69|nr:uncharacterized protein LOC124283975 [Haliotis rubra]
MLLWEGTCAKQDLSNSTLALFNSRYAESPGFPSGQCFVLLPGQHVLSDHPCVHRHPFICELHATDGVSINSQNTTGYMEEGDDSETPHPCEPAVLDGQTTTETDPTTQVTSVPTDETSSPANDNIWGLIIGGLIEASSPANDTFVGADENTSPANDQHVDADETSSPVIVNYSDEVTFVPSDVTPSPANDHHVDETSSPVIVNYSGEMTSVPSDVTPSPANDHHVDETSSPVIVNYSANDNYSDADETTSPPIVNYTREDETSSPANDNSGTTDNIVDSADSTPRAAESQVCREYNIPVMSEKELDAVLAAIAKRVGRGQGEPV